VAMDLDRAEEPRREGQSAQGEADEILRPLHRGREAPQRLPFQRVQGDEARVFLSSADMMTRNLDFRVEVAWPIFDDRLKQELLDILELQWQDSIKARVLNRAQNNRFRHMGGPTLRAQEAIGAYLARNRAPHP